MAPLDLFRSRTVAVSVAVGFAFIVGYYGLPFVMSLYLQQLRGLSPLGTGAAFLPMMLTGAALTPLSARIAEKLGAKVLITAGLVSMTAGLVILAGLPSATPVPALAAVMVLVGLAGPLVMPPLIAVLLNSVPAYRTGVASGVFNASRQLGGALAVAVFGALLAHRASFLPGVRASLLIAAAVALAAAAASMLLRTAEPRLEHRQGRQLVLQAGNPPQRAEQPVPTFLRNLVQGRQAGKLMELAQLIGVHGPRPVRRAVPVGQRVTPPDRLQIRGHRVEQQPRTGQ
jgi:MFS family permease